MTDTKMNRICPVERAAQFDSKLRRWFQNPQKILAPYIHEGMTLLDFGCGPGYFTIDMASLTGPSGKVVASDIQTGMLDKLQEKIKGTDIESRITLHQCNEDGIGLSEKLDFILAFYVVHEVIDQENFFSEVKNLLKPGGKLFMAEPRLHVSRASFKRSIAIAEKKGFEAIARPKVFLSQTVVLKNEG